jgi:hypothetical protein
MKAVIIFGGEWSSYKRNVKTTETRYDRLLKRNVPVIEEQTVNVDMRKAIAFTAATAETPADAGTAIYMSGWITEKILGEYRNSNLTDRQCMVYSDSLASQEAILLSAFLPNWNW